jgi:hypothetical protein
MLQSPTSSRLLITPSAPCVRVTLAIVACAIGVVMAWAGLSAHDRGHVPGTVCSARTSVAATRHGRHCHPALSMPLAITEAEVSPDDYESSGPSAARWPIGNSARRSRRSPSSCLNGGGQDPSALFANAADLRRLCRLLI